MVEAWWLVWVTRGAGEAGSGSFWLGPAARWMRGRVKRSVSRVALLSRSI